MNTKASKPGWLVLSWAGDFWYTVRRYRRTFGRWPNLIHPKTFNEHLNYKKLFCRDPLLTELADKYAVRQYIQERIGGAYLTELYLVTDSLEEIDFSLLPNSFVIKTTHGSGWNIIVKDKSSNQEQSIKHELKQWLELNYYDLGREWCYKNVKPQIIVEEFLCDEHGNIPYDYKFFCFNGRVKFIQVDADRFEHHTRNLYDTKWNRLHVRLMYDNFNFLSPAPHDLEQMIDVAEKLASELDFVRVDLYSVGNKIYFGEMTHYPGNGFENFYPAEFDTLFGTYWNFKQ